MKKLDTIKTSIENEMMSELLQLNYVDTIIHKKGYDIWIDCLNIKGDVKSIVGLYKYYNNNIFIKNMDSFWMMNIPKYFNKYFMDYETKQSKIILLINIINGVVNKWLKNIWDDEKERVLKITLIDNTIYNEDGFIVKEMSKVSKKKINSILNNLNKK